MIGPGRPLFVLFGSSIVQFSFINEGWGAILADIYARKADIVVRGYAGWNSRQALKVLHQIFPKDAAVQPSLVIVYFGGNDSAEPHPSGFDPHVPLPEYIDNMKKIAVHLKGLSDKTRVMFLSVPSVSEELMTQTLGFTGRTNETSRIYSEACLRLCREVNVKCIDLWTALQQRNDWKTACFMDGIHLSAEGSKVVIKEILKALREAEAEWEPSLYWRSLPIEFEDVSPDGKSIINFSDVEISRNAKWE